MSYDYFLWRTNRIVEPDELDESTVESWQDVDSLRETISDLWPTMVWSQDGHTGDDCSGASSVRAVSLPSPDKAYDPLVIRASLHASSVVDLLRLGECLECLVYDTQSGEIVYQPVES